VGLPLRCVTCVLSFVYVGTFVSVVLHWVGGLHISLQRRYKDILNFSLGCYVESKACSAVGTSKCLAVVCGGCQGRCNVKDNVFVVSF